MLRIFYIYGRGLLIRIAAFLAGNFGVFLILFFLVLFVTKTEKIAFFLILVLTNDTKDVLLLSLGLSVGLCFGLLHEANALRNGGEGIREVFGPSFSGREKTYGKEEAEIFPETESVNAELEAETVEEWERLRDGGMIPPHLSYQDFKAGNWIE